MLLKLEYCHYLHMTIQMNWYDWLINHIPNILCPEVEKSDFSCSLKPPEIKISGKCIYFLVYQKKNYCNIFIHSDFI